MKRDFLKGLNLEADVIDAIMAQYGADVESLKTENAEQADKIQALEDGIKTRDEQLETLKNSTDDIEALKTQIDTLQNENKTAAEKYQNELKQVKINTAVEKALATAKAKNNKVVAPLLAEFLSNAEVDETGIVKGLDEQIKMLVEGSETSFLFDSGAEPKAVLTGVVPGEKGDSPAGFIDQNAFNANKDNPDWINQNWATISAALQEGTIKK